jgi:probable F420-dependent oxidoreductase
MYGVPGLAWDPGYQYTAEPLTVLTLAAAVTETVRLGTCLLVAGLHSSHQLARTLSTLDRATGGGRVVAGLGGGWSSDEFRASGADFEHRGRLLDETMDALAALWGPNPVTYRDSRMAVENALVTPKPVSPIPVMLGGGNSKRALDRIARRADGWIPTGMPTSAMVEQWHTIRDLADSHGRSADAIEMVPLMHLSIADSASSVDGSSFQRSIAQAVDEISELAETGVSNEAILAFHGVDSGKELTDTSCALLQALSEAGLHDAG